MSHATGSHGRPPSRSHAPTRRPWPSFLKLEEASISILSDDDALINPKAEFVIPGLIQKRKRLAFFKLAREPSQRLARRCRPSWPPPSTVIGCATTHPLGNALVGARIAHLHTLSDYSCLRCHVSQPSRNKPGPRRFDDRDCDREGRVALSTRSRVVIESKMSFECLLDTDDARTHFMYIVKHLRVSSAAPVVAVAALNRSYETRLDVQIRCDIDSTDYLPLSRASQHSDTLICNRTSGLVGSCAYSACNKSS